MLLIPDFPIAYAVSMKLTRNEPSLRQRQQAAIADRYIDIVHVWLTSVH
jgi:hypothetical protein